jgi:hypothetical protein
VKYAFPRQACKNNPNSPQSISLSESFKLVGLYLLEASSCATTLYARTRSGSSVVNSTTDTLTPVLVPYSTLSANSVCLWNKCFPSEPAKQPKTASDIFQRGAEYGKYGGGWQ